MIAWSGARGSWRAKRAPRAGLALAGAFACGFVACGGTSGREGLPQASTADLPADGGADTTASPADGASTDAAADSTRSPADSPAGSPAEASGDDGGFDAGIEYADSARLPDVFAPGTADSGAAVVNAWASWPVCAPDIPFLDDNGDLLGGEATDDAGACPVYDWTALSGSDAGMAAGQACDECIRSNACGAASILSNAAYGIFPPCSDLRAAGTSSQGPPSLAGKPLFDLCAGLFECVLRTGCAISVSPPKVVNCYCGTAKGQACLQPGAANGACMLEIEGAMQLTDPMSITGLLTDPTATAAWHAGAEVMGLFDCALTGQTGGYTSCNACFPDAGVDGG